MPDLVINTGPLIALTATVGTLGFLDKLYNQITVPQEVFVELQAGGIHFPELQAISQVKCMSVTDHEVEVPRFLKAELDGGEGSVIQTALARKIPLVAIDEKHGRRIARLHGLRVTGSIGILVKAAKAGLIDDFASCLDRMKAHGIWISHAIQEQALHDLKK